MRDLHEVGWKRSPWDEGSIPGRAVLPPAPDAFLSASV